MATAFEKFPEDQEVAALYALALVATVPPDQISSPNNAKAAEILLKILEKNPRHPGAMHYLIHANDAPGRERESLEILREYAAIAPHNPHALHMPTHIYTRLGDWEKVISGNIQAADAALEFPAGDLGQYVWDEFPHAIEYLIYAYLQIGQDGEAEAQLKRLQRTARLEPTFKTAFHLSSTRARFALERRAWGEAASLEPGEPQTVDWGHFPWPEAITWFARGLASVHLGRSEEAGKSLGRLQELESASFKSGEVLFTRNIRVLRLGLAAWSADLEGKRDSSVALMTQAAELEASTPKHPVTPAPTLPAYELLGDLLLKQGKASEAVKAYQRSLKLNPRRFNSLLGGARASRSADDREAAAALYRQLLDLASPKSTREGLEEARNFLPE
jgi:tetratricopeptide (TPR) repeat protein